MCVCVQVQVPVDYYEDQELAVFHEVIAKEACMRKCKDKEVKGYIGGIERSKGHLIRMMAHSVQLLVCFIINT